MWDEFVGTGPIDSYDAYAMGLRPPRCNGCKLEKLKYELGDKFLMLGGSVYELDAESGKGQGEPSSYKDRPIKFRFYGMSYGHSDECYHWKPPEPKDDDLPF